MKSRHYTVNRIRSSLIFFLILFCCGLIVNGFILNGQALIPYGSGQAWGSADTLQPRADGSVLWNQSGCAAGERYDCVDDPPGNPDSNATYAYTSAINKAEEFWHDSTFVSNIDSVVIRINAKKTGGTVKLYVGWAYYTEALWHFWIEDTVTLTSSYADYSVNADDEQNWTYQKINARRFGVHTAGSMTGIWSANLKQVFVIVYYTEAGEEAKKQGGIVQDEDSKGIVEGGIARWNSRFKVQDSSLLVHTQFSGFYS